MKPTADITCLQRKVELKMDAISIVYTLPNNVKTNHYLTSLIIFDVCYIYYEKLTWKWDLLQ